MTIYFATISHQENSFQVLQHAFARKEGFDWRHQSQWIQTCETYEEAEKVAKEAGPIFANKGAMLCLVETFPSQCSLFRLGANQVVEHLEGAMTWEKGKERLKDLEEALSLPSITM